MVSDVLYVIACLPLMSLKIMVAAHITRRPLPSLVMPMAISNGVRRRPYLIVWLCPCSCGLNEAESRFLFCVPFYLVNDYTTTQQRKPTAPPSHFPALHDNDSRHADPNHSTTDRSGMSHSLGLRSISRRAVGGPCDDVFVRRTNDTPNRDLLQKRRRRWQQPQACRRPARGSSPPPCSGGPPAGGSAIRFPSKAKKAMQTRSILSSSTFFFSFLVLMRPVRRGDPVKYKYKRKRGIRNFPSPSRCFSSGGMDSGKATKYFRKAGRQLNTTAIYFGK